MSSAKDGGGVTVSSFVVSETTRSLPLDPHQKTGLSLSRSFVHRQTWRLTGNTNVILSQLYI